MRRETACERNCPKEGQTPGCPDGRANMRRALGVWFSGPSFPSHAVLLSIMLPSLIVPQGSLESAPPWENDALSRLRLHRLSCGWKSRLETRAIAGTLAQPELILSRCCLLYTSPSPRDS